MDLFRTIVLAILLVPAVLFYVVVGLLVNPKKTYERDSRFYRRLLIFTTGFGLRMLGVRIHTTGLERVPEGVHCLFVSNHRSNFDPLVTWYVFRDKSMAYIAKPSLFRIPAFGRIIHRCRFMPIDRDSARNAMDTFKRASELLGAQELSIGVYPEGTRCKSGDMLPFHNAVFRVAQQANAPIVVMALRGTQTIHKNLPFHHSDVYLDVVDVIEPSDMQGVRTCVIGDRVRAAIEDVLQTEER